MTRSAFRISLVFAGAAAVLSACASPPPPPAEKAEPSYYKHLTAADVKVDPVAARDMISIYRRNHGLTPVALDPDLQAQAQAQANAMASADRMSHEVRGSLMQRLDGAHFAHSAAVENISAGYITLAEAFSGWRDSPPHNANMLAPGMRRMGIATAFAPRSKYKVYWSLIMTD